PAVGVEVVRRKPAAKVRRDGWPLVIEEREPMGVPIAPFHDLMLIKRAFEAEAEPARSPLGIFVASVALPLAAAVPKARHRVIDQQIERLGRRAGVLRL